jgi:hypothetical protein
MGTENDLAAGIGVAWPIPAFAKEFRVAAMPNNSVLDVRVVRQGGLTVCSYPALAYPTVTMPIPNDAWAVTIFNAGGAPVTSHRIIFELSL